MKDSLSLSDVQKTQVFNINMQLQAQKMDARNQYPIRDTLVKKMQLIENKRDSLYGTVLTGAQFILYRPKKKNLVNNN